MVATAVLACRDIVAVPDPSGFYANVGLAATQRSAATICDQRAQHLSCNNGQAARDEMEAYVATTPARLTLST